MATLAAVILAGGAGRRLSNVDKPALVVGGRRLLDRALDAVEGADPIVVVGPRREVSRPVRWAREDPPGSGPVAGIAAGIAVLCGTPAPGRTGRAVKASHDQSAAMPTKTTETMETTLVAVLAADLVGVTSSTIARLVDAVDADVDGVVLIDADGRAQWLIGVWRLAALRTAMPTDPHGRSLREVF
ncbi:MAG: NTP transferase domain-containing protein, partial [Sciscionella sp.]|nr:NTP transferase domain-containing protein [Sciscionella sp.]